MKIKTGKIILSAVILLYGLLANSQTVDKALEPAPRVSEKELILLEIEKLEKAENIDLAEALSQMSERISLYADARKKECTGEYSSIEITPEGESKRVENKLTKEEKKLCLLELIKLRKTFANSLFNIRERLLRKQHKEQLESLEDQRGETLKELDSMAAKLK